MNRTIQDYDKYAKDLAEKFDKIGTRVNDIRKLFSFNKKKNPRVLELGCAHGRDAQEILKHTSNYIGVDASEGLLNIAKNRLPQAEFICQEFHKLEFPDNSFDVVIEFASIMHYDKTGLKEIFQNIYQWLTSDGLLMISMKEGKYSKLLSKGHGERTQYVYEIDDIKQMTKSRFKILDIEKTHFRDQNWFTAILKKP